MHRLVPADGAEPAQRRRAHVSDGAERVGERDHGSCDAVHPASRRGQLGRHQRGRGEEGATQREADTHRDRVCPGQPVGHEAEPGDSPDDDGRQERCDPGGGQRRTPTDGSGSHELFAALLLLGTGVAAHEEHAHQADGDRTEGCGLPHDLSPGGVECSGRPGHGDEGRVALHQRGCPIEVGLRGVEPVHAHGLRHEENTDAEAPPEQLPAVATQERGQEQPPPRRRSAQRPHVSGSSWSP